jgi:peptidoglycan LD-endopeptidase LytH
MTLRATLPPFEPGRFKPVIAYPGPFEVFDFGSEYDADAVERAGWGIGKYDERRSSDMYNSHLYVDGRTVHMGLDLWGPSGTPVMAFLDGRIYAKADNANPRDYGPTVVTEHELQGVRFWALFGHLSRESLAIHDIGDTVSAGTVLGYFGDREVNGGWAPHLHLQLSLTPPLDADMPGVVHPQDRAWARATYADPRLVVGPLY